MNNRAWRDLQLKVIIQYNAHLKANEVRDYCNIEMNALKCRTLVSYC